MDIANLFSLDGSIALVTGGSTGIGRMIAQGFLSAGCARVYISARSNERLEQTALELGENAVPLVGDISTMGGIEILAAELEEREPRLNILVNNAGAVWGESFESFTEHGWDSVVDINLKTPFFLTQKMHNLLKAGASPQRPAKVINIASTDSLRLNLWETYSYQASKAGLLQLTRRMAARLIQDNIVMNGIAPGAFPSEMNRAARFHREQLEKAIPSHRIGMPEDIATGAIYLASRAGDYVVGSMLPIDGGLVNASLPSISIDPKIF